MLQDFQYVPDVRLQIKTWHSNNIVSGFKFYLNLQNKFYKVSL